jgi:hypothetical protein
MKRVLAVTALAIFGLVPAMGSACEYNDDSAASAAPPAQLGLASPPAASKVPAPTIAKALAQKAVNKMADKAKPLAPDRKLAVVTSN